jgi:hypothetical protein
VSQLKQATSIRQREILFSKLHLPILQILTSLSASPSLLSQAFGGGWIWLIFLMA